QIDRRSGGEQIQCGFRIVDSDGAIVELFEQGYCNRLDLRIVLHDQNCFAAAGRQICSFSRYDEGDWSVTARQINGDLCALAELACNRNCPARLVRKSVSLRKTKAGAFSGRLGREKRLEYSRQ